MGEGVLSVRDESGIQHRDGEAFCDGVPLRAIADAVGTPSYVYSAAAIRAEYAKLTSALAGVSHRIHYSVKANSSLALLSLLRELGAGVDIVSGGELFRALKAGFTGRDIVFSGVGKTDTELREAIAAEVRLVNVESEGELRRLSDIASAAGVVVPVALRVNPEVDVETPHKYTTTGERGMKFGIPWDSAEQLGKVALALPGIKLAGLDMHIGSQVARVESYRSALERMIGLHGRLRAAGANDITCLDMGGGLAVAYGVSEEATNVGAFGKMVASLVAPTGLELILEPGRFLVGNAGVLLARVLDRKHSGGREYIIVDAGMTELLRPSHYGAYHRIEPAVTSDAQSVTADIVGPVCESGDFLALSREIADVAPGDLLVVYSAGAYGFVMASNYNSRPRPPEVLVDGDRFGVITERQSYADLIRGERISPEWRES